MTLEDVLGFVKRIIADLVTPPPPRESMASHCDHDLDIPHHLFLIGVLMYFFFFFSLLQKERLRGQMISLQRALSSACRAEINE